MHLRPTKQGAKKLDLNITEKSKPSAAKEQRERQPKSRPHETRGKTNAVKCRVRAPGYSSTQPTTALEAPLSYHARHKLLTPAERPHINIYCDYAASAPSNPPGFRLGPQPPILDAGSFLRALPRRCLPPSDLKLLACQHV